MTVKGKCGTAFVAVLVFALTTTNLFAAGEGE